MKLTKRLFLFILCLVLVAPAFAGCKWEATENPSGSKLAVVINEAVPKNDSVLADSDGDYSDYIELYNPTSGQINLKGSYLTDNEEKPRKWELPNVYIQPHSYLVIFASGKDKKDAAKGEYHTNFSVSAKGESLLLIDGEGVVASRLDIPACDIADISYGLVQSGEGAGTAAWFAKATPGAENTGDHNADYTKLTFTTVKLYINEYMTRNKAVLYDADGDYSDWLELYNPGAEEVSLAGMYLSDRSDKTDKWQFPAGSVIKPGEYLVIFLSGKDKVAPNGEIHASFSLGANDDRLTLSDPGGRPIDSTEITALPENVSRGRMPDNLEAWKLFVKPTPGKANTGTGYDDLDALAGAVNNGVWINEVCAAPDNIDDYDWVELYNNTNQPVSLKGYGLSKNLEEPYAYTFPDLTIPANGFLVLYASGGDEVKGAKSRSMPFALSTAGNTLFLTGLEGGTVDVFSFGKLRAGISSGRKDGKLSQRWFFLAPTPGESNTKTGYAGYAALPAFSSEGGYANAGDALSLSVPAGATVRYTVDGSLPTQNSQQYTGPIAINKTQTVRAATFQEGLIPSDTATATFVVGVTHKLPVIAINGNPDDFFSYERGIFAKGPGYTDTFPHTGANFWKDWEREVNVTYFDESGKKQISFGAGIRTFGQYSRAEDQKSVSLHIRDRYGNDGVTYPFFDNNPVTHFNAMVLRMGGQDGKYSKIRDSMVARVAKEGGFNVAFMDTRPVVVYLNGEYWGLYDLREKINEAYFENRDGQDRSTINIIKGNSKVLAGSYAGYKEILEYVKGHDLAKTEYYEYVKSKVDIDSLIDCWILITYFVNTDSGNFKFYTGADGKWHYVVYDFDWCFWSSTYDWNYFKQMLHDKGHGVGKNFSTVLMRGLMKNAEFKQLFIDKYENAVKTILNPTRLCAIIDNMAAAIADEIPRQYEKWGNPSKTTFENHIKTLNKIAKEKPALTVEQFMESFGMSRAEAERRFLVD